MPDVTLCPGCGSAMARASDGTIRNECASCGGRLFGLAPFERMLQDGVGARIWVASGTFGDAGVNCPFCSNAMRQPSADAHPPPGMAVCHICQQVWVPGSAADWMAAHVASGLAPLAPPAPVAAPPVHCENCGAPFEPDATGHCPYCHVQLQAPEAPVIIVDPYGAARPAPTIHTGSRLLDSLASILTQPVD